MGTLWYTTMEVRDFDKYVTKVDGSGRLTLRNRRYLKKFYQDKGMFATAQTTKNSNDLAEATKEPQTLSEATDELITPETDYYGSPYLPCPNKPSIPSPAKYLLETSLSKTLQDAPLPPATPNSLPTPTTPRRLIETLRRSSATLPPTQLVTQMQSTPKESRLSPEPHSCSPV